MRLILHVGFHKTGTSAIQTFCRENQAQLASHGVLYPSVGITPLEFTSTPSSEAGHRAFTDVLVAPLNQKSELQLQEVVAEAQDFGGIDTVLISSETFSAPRVKISPSLLESLQRHFRDIKILMYLRRQDDWAESFYKEILCWPGKRIRHSFKRFVSSNLPEWLDYNTRINKWSEVFGDQNLIVKSYDDRVNKNIIADFFLDLGLNLDELDGFKYPGYNNPSLPDDLVPLMRFVNRKKLDRKRRSQVTNHIFNQLADSGHSVLRQPNLTEAIRSKLIARYQPMNEAICERFQLQNCPKFRFDESRQPQENEISLTREQVNSTKRMVEDYARETGKKFILDRDRIDKGAVGISCLLNEDPQQVKIFVLYHLALGVSRIRLYFDNPEDPMADYDYGSEKVEVIRCDREFWHQQLGRDPHNNGEKLSTCHMDGLNTLNKLEDIDWVINLDADELLYVKTGTLSEYLSSVARRYLQIQVRPLEAIFVRDEDSQLFNARYFKVPRINLKGKRFPSEKGILRMSYYSALYLIEKISNLNWVRWALLKYSQTACMFLAWSERDECLYRKYMPQLSKVMRDGFLGHRLGRMFSRHGIEFDRVTSHKPEFSEWKSNTLLRNNTIFVLHYDAANFEAWHLKWHRRIFGNTTASAIHDKRRIQQDMFKEACEAGEDEVRELFKEFFVFPENSLLEFERAGLLVKLDLPLLKETKQEIGA